MENFAIKKKPISKKIIKLNESSANVDNSVVKNSPKNIITMGVSSPKNANKVVKLSNGIDILTAYISTSETRFAGYNKEIKNESDNSSQDSKSSSEDSKNSSQNSCDNFIDLSVPHINKEQIEKIAGRKINKVGLYQKALVHKSVQGVVSKTEGFICEYMKTSNERLEFLGDSILGTIVTKFLCKTYPEADEGALTKMRTRIVRSNTLARFADKIGLTGCILMSPYVIKAGGKTNPRFLEDAFEAFVGAMSEDLGDIETEKFILEILNKYITNDEITKDENYKDLLLRYTQFFKMEAPIYTTVSTVGPPNNRTFTINVSIFDQILGTGIERTKKKAEQIASQQAVEKLKITEELFKQERPS